VNFKNLIFGVLTIVVMTVGIIFFVGKSQSTDATDANPADTSAEWSAPKDSRQETPQDISGKAAKVPQEPLAPLQTKDLTIGATKQVVEGSKVSFNIIVKLQDGRIVFDSYKDGRPWKGVIGDGSLLTGIDRGILGMFQGGKRALWIPSHLAYGPSGITPQVPPNAKLYAEVELLSVF